MTETTLNVRQENPEETDSMASLEEPDNDVYGYLSRKVSGQLGEFMEVTISQEADVTATLDGVTGKGSGNYARYETPGGAIVGFGISLDVLADVFDISIERDDDDIVQNAPESVGLTFAQSTEEEYEDAQEADEEEVDGLLADAGSDDEVEVETDESDEAEELLAEAEDAA